jgi:hypothetical protein
MDQHLSNKSWQKGAVFAFEISQANISVELL